MEKAIRVVSIERGRDPRHFALVAFGGAGGLHACALAEALSIPTVIVPALPGALSALGILGSDVVKDYSRTVLWRVSEPVPTRQLDREFALLEKSAASDFRDEVWQGSPHFSPQRRPPLPRPGIRTESSRHQKSADRFRARTQTPLRLHPPESRDRTSNPPPPRNPEIDHECSTQGRPCRDGTPSSVQAERSSAGFPRSKPKFCSTERSEKRRSTRAKNSIPKKKYAGPAVVTEYSATTVIPPRQKLHLDPADNLMIALG